MSHLIDIVHLPPMLDDDYGASFRDPVRLMSQDPMHMFRYHPKDMWRNSSVPLPDLQLGLPVTFVPDQMFKSISVSTDRKHVMECVFVQPRADYAVFLYGTMHSYHDRVIGISSSGIGELAKGYIACPIIHFVRDYDCAFIKSHRDMVLIPPIFTPEDLDAYLCDVSENLQVRGEYLPIDPPFQHMFQIFPKESARIIYGGINESPFRDIRVYDQDYIRYPQKWSLMEEGRYSSHVTDSCLIPSPPSFDPICLEILQRLPQQFRAEINIMEIMMAPQGVMSGITVSEIFDPFASIFGRTALEGMNRIIGSRRLFKRLITAFFRYCDDAHHEVVTDPQAVLKIMVSTREEMIFQFKWFNTSRTMTFYTHVPSLMRSTKAVAWFSDV